MSTMTSQRYDAIIVGAGFGGIYQLHKLIYRGLRVKLIEQAPDVGGTWYWNRYPGAMSDTESYIYRFSWDKDDLKQYHWKDHYMKQPDSLAYLRHVVERHGLRGFMQFSTQLTSAEFDEVRDVWRIETSTNEAFTARYLVTALGLLSKQNYPSIPGLDTFKGELYHTGAWPEHYDFKDKRVGVIGNGSTGVQVITAIAPVVKQLVTFQRHPQYSVPSGDGPVSEEYRNQVNENYDQIWDQVRNSTVGFGFEESTVPAMSVSESERERKFQEAWDKGNGFRFMFWTFSDISTNPEANEAACQFIRRKISETIKDPEKARKLTPHDFYARRPLCDAGYYKRFNQENVEVVALAETPITKITETGVEISNGTQDNYQHFDLDVLILATGFDAVDGNYTRVAIKGRDGKSLAEHWKASPSGPNAYLGIFVPDFPNMMMILGPNGPFTNVPPCIEMQVDFIADVIARAEFSLDWFGNRDHRGRSNSIGSRPVIEATREAQEEWTRVCEKASKASLFWETPSWIFGANVKGKVPAYFFFDGLKKYREKLEEVADEKYKGFVPF